MDQDDVTSCSLGVEIGDFRPTGTWRQVHGHNAVATDQIIGLHIPFPEDQIGLQLVIV
jgi:hypothetical protein